MTTSDQTLLDEHGMPYAELVETHISWVHLGAAEVVKRKKPVRFPFVDFSTHEKRLVACGDEVRLNRRLAPDVYLGVVPITRDASGVLRVGGEGPVVDHAVRMIRLSDADRSDVRLREGRLAPEKMDELAGRLAGFHAEAEVDADPNGPGSTKNLLAHVRENLEALREFGRERLGEARWRAVESSQLEGVERLSPLLDRRREAGRVRDGHGDLRLEHLYFGDDGTLRVLDCVEFDRAFRVADVSADVAFLVMDLYANGQAELAERFVARYARDSGDHELYRLLDFYVAYFALVRAKVSVARAAQESSEKASCYRARAQDFLELASRFSAPSSDSGCLLAFAGPIASGKSTLARYVGAELGVPVIESDRLRKQLHGVAPEDRLVDEAAYGAETTERIYRELLERARAVLASGRTVVLDATYRSRSHRRAVAALAAELRVPYRLVMCTAPREVLAQRLRQRERGPSVSDARIDLLDEFLAGFEALEADELPNAIEVDTSREPLAVERDLLVRIEPLVRRPAAG